MRCFVAIVGLILVATFLSVAWFWVDWLKAAENAQVIEVVSGAFSAVISTLALIVGGWWAYQRFISGRQHIARGSLSLALGSHAPSKAGIVLLHVVIHVKNTGSKLLKLKRGTVEVDRVDPPLQKGATWPAPGQAFLSDSGADEAPWDEEAGAKLRFSGRLLEGEAEYGPVEIEPGETERIGITLTVSDDARLVRIYCWLTDLDGADPMGWGIDAFYDLNAKKVLAAPPGIKSDASSS